MGKLEIQYLFLRENNILRDDVSLLVTVWLLSPPLFGKSNLKRKALSYRSATKIFLLQVRPILP